MFKIMIYSFERRETFEDKPFLIGCVCVCVFVCVVYDFQYIILFALTSKHICNKK